MRLRQGVFFIILVLSLLPALYSCLKEIKFTTSIFWPCLADEIKARCFLYSLSSLCSFLLNERSLSYYLYNLAKIKILTRNFQDMNIGVPIEYLRAYLSSQDFHDHGSGHPKDMIIVTLLDKCNLYNVKSMESCLSWSNLSPFAQNLT